MRRSLPAGLGLIALALASARPAMALDPQSLCWRDYPIPAPAVRYEQAFASETLAPDRISVNGKTVTLGLTEKNLNDLLRMTSTEVEDWRQRSDQEQCEYLLEVLRRHPNSMHLYKLGQIKLKKMSGLFRVAEWQLPDVGILRAFFHKPSADKPETAYLYHLTLLPVALDKVQRKSGQRYVLTKTGASKVEWDIETNRVSIATRAHGG